MTSQLKRFDESVNLIIHDVNVSHSIDCNPRARYHIQKNCIIIHNRAIMKYNDLKEWIAGNPDASLHEVGEVIKMIDNGENVRGFKFEHQPIIEEWFIDALKRYIDED